MAWPRLTTIRQPDLEMAAIDSLVGAGVRGKAAVELPYSLLRRPSSGRVGR